MKTIALLSVAVALVPASAFAQPAPFTPPAAPPPSARSALDGWRIEPQREGIILNRSDLDPREIFLVALEPDLDTGRQPLHAWFAAAVTAHTEGLGTVVEHGAIQERADGSIMTVRVFERDQGRRLNAAVGAAHQPDGKLLLVTMICTTDSCLRHAAAAQQAITYAVASGLARPAPDPARSYAAPALLPSPL
ncbi:MAG TPA: hypothetical protein VKB80_19660 [Kofleriaceae bacterium]|nr:hypothetical protein [Kofleriaceae bacterium]